MPLCLGFSSFVSVTTGDVKDENMMRSNETTNSLVLGYDIDSENVSRRCPNLLTHCFFKLVKSSVNDRYTMRRFQSGYDRRAGATCALTGLAVTGFVMCYVVVRYCNRL
jgi:SUMO ligase MMS21 Smc5/6 complex component